MSTPKGTEIEGDLSVYAATSSALGNGDGYFQRYLLVDGTLDTSSSSTGSGVFTGGVGIVKGLTVGLLTSLQQTTISTNNGALSISGTNAISASVAGSSTINVSSGSLTLSASTNNIISGTSSVQISSSTGGVTLNANSTSSFTVTGGFDLTHSSTLGRVVITSGKNSSDAILLQSTNSASGITLLGGTFGLTATMTNGPILLSSNGVASSWTHTATGNGQHLTLSVLGSTSSRLNLSSQGTTNDSIFLSSSAGGLTINAVTTMTTVVSNGSISLSATGSSSLFSNTSTGNSQNLTISLLGNFASSLILSSTGTGSSAIQMTASASTGGINISSGTGGLTASTTGAFSISGTSTASSLNLSTTGDNQNLSISLTGTSDSKIIVTSSGTGSSAVNLIASSATGGITGTCGSGGINLTSTTGRFAISASSIASFITQATSGSSQDFTISQTGAFASRLIISTASTPSNALQITASAGGISMSATKNILIDTTDTTNGITIGNTNNVPVFIGGSTSETTVRSNLTVSGNLTVVGTSSIIQSQIVTINDNIIALNNAPSGSTDGGLVTKRYQYANDTSQGDVIQDTASHTFTATAGTSTTITLPSGASSSNNFYNGYWILITSGTGSGQTRRIKGYVGSTRVATIYSTADQTTTPVLPLQGLDFSTSPDATSVVNLYNGPYCGVIYQESTDFIKLAYSNLDPSSGGNLNITRNANLSCLNIQSNGILTIDTINEFTGGNGVTISSVNIKNGALTGVTTINGATLPTDFTINLVDNSTTGVNLPGSSNYGTYQVWVGASSNTNGAFAMFSISGNATYGFQIQRMSSAIASTGESLTISSVAGSVPVVKHDSIRIIGASGANLTYKVKIYGVF